MTWTKAWWLLAVAVLAAVAPIPQGATLHLVPTADASSGYRVEIGHADQRAGAQVGSDMGSGGMGTETRMWIRPDSSRDGDDDTTQLIAIVPPTADDADFQLPNLVPLPAYDIEIGEPDGPLTGVDAVLDELGRQEDQVEGPVLRFTTTIQNRGDYSLELIGVLGEPDPETNEVTTIQGYQCVGWAGPEYEAGHRICAAYASIGTMTYHAYHRHFHIDGFARYQLRRDDNGRPMRGPGSVVASSSKVGWCVSDMERPRDPDGEPLPQDPWYQECSGIGTVSPVSMRQGISPGWGDTYWYQFAGQQISLSGVSDGVYWISIWMNPPDNPFNLEIRETDRTDNMSFQRVRISGGRTVVEVLP